MKQQLMGKFGLTGDLPIFFSFFFFFIARVKQRGKKALNDSSSHIKLEGELAHNHSIFEGFSVNESPRGLKTTSFE